MKQIVNMAHYWTQEVKRLSACTDATEAVYRANIDEIQSDTLTAPADPSLAAPSAATASPSTPVSVIEHATLAPVDVYTKPASEIDLMPTPVIEYIAPSAAVSYPSFLPSIDQIHEAVTDSEKPQFSITADETSKMSVERIQEQSAVSDLVTSVESSPVVDSVPLLHAVVNVIPESRVPAPQVQEPVLGQGIPELQVVEQKMEQIFEAMEVNLLERVQRRAIEQSVSLFERLEEFDKRLEMSEARRAENYELIKEIGVLWEERKRQEWLSGGFELTDDDQRNLRESSKKKKKRNLNRTVQIMEQIPEHSLMSSDQEGLDRWQHDWWSGGWDDAVPCCVCFTKSP